MSTDLRVSVLVEDQFPEFVREEGPKLVAFIKAYYEWLETTGQATDVSKNILNYQDIDRTVDKFIDYFSREVMHTIPKSVLSDKRLLVKNIQDFYKSKGTENAYKLLFRILYNEEIELFYPGQEILRVSDGRWSFEKVLRLTDPNGNIFALGGQIITGVTTGATAKVDKVLSTVQSGIVVYECYISNIIGEFIDNEQVRNNNSSITGITVSDYGKVKSVVLDVSNSGTGHVSGDRITFISASGTGANGFVVDVGGSGEILTVSINNEGTNYKRVDRLTLHNIDRAAANAYAYPVTTAIISNPGRYTDTKGFVSWNNRIQDSRYYQEFSYVMRSENVISKYRDFVTKLLHPAGDKMFGEVSVRLEVDTNSTFAIDKEVVNTTTANIDSIIVTASLIPEYNEVFESPVMEAQSPIADFDITKYNIILEPINDEISTLDMHFEYVTEVEFVHSNEIEFPVLNVISTVKDLTIANGDSFVWYLSAGEALTPGANIAFNDVVHLGLISIGGMEVIRTYSIPAINATTTFSSDAQLNFEFLDPFVGVEPVTTTVPTDHHVVMNIQGNEITITDKAYSEETLQGGDYDWITGSYANVSIFELSRYTLDDKERFGIAKSELYLLPLSIPPLQREFGSFYGFGDYQSNTVSVLANTVIGSLVTIEQFGLPELNMSLAETFPGVLSTIVVPNTAMLVHIIDATFTTDQLYNHGNTVIQPYGNDTISSRSIIRLSDPTRFGDNQVVQYVVQSSPVVIDITEFSYMTPADYSSNTINQLLNVSLNDTLTRIRFGNTSVISA